MAYVLMSGLRQPTTRTNQPSLKVEMFSRKRKKDTLKKSVDKMIRMKN